MSREATSARANQRHYRLDVTAYIRQQRLHLEWKYSQPVHRRETIQARVDEMVAALQDLVAHCRQPGAGGYSPSDFPLARLEQAQLDR